MRGFTVLIVLALLSLSATANGGAKEHFINGREYYDRGQYKDAIEEFEKAYRLDQKPLLLYNIAQAYEKLGKLKKSVEYLRQFLEEDTKKEDTASVENKITNLEARIQKTGITVMSSEDGTDVYVDDQKVGVTPIPGVIPLDEGMHRIRLSKPGFKDFAMNTGVSTGYAVPVDAKLEPADDAYVSAKPAGPIVAKKDPTEPPPPAPIEPPKQPVSDTPTKDKKKIHALDVVPWVIAGVGAVTAIVGLGVIGGIALSKDDHDRAVVADIVGWTGVGLAAAGTAWGIVRIVTKKKRGAQPSKSAVSLVPIIHPSHAGVAASVNF